ncbi:hypothetical protein E1171_20115 [Cytophagales bacterium RKSG123]|nr:hypothetical protein [Xanthovirga aplysinae]
MREEKLPNEYRFLYQRFQILGDFWISSAEVSKGGIDKRTVSIYVSIINQSIFPYLTAKGEKEYFLLTSS